MTKTSECDFFIFWPMRKMWLTEWPLSTVPAVEGKATEVNRVF